MLQKNFIAIVALLMLFFSTTTFIAQSSGTLDNNKVYIPYVDFQNGDVTVDGQASEQGFFSFTITVKDGKLIHVHWRHNADTLHVVLNTDGTGWVAAGWTDATPSATTGANVMLNMNIITGSSDGVRDDTGGAGTHQADEVNNIIESEATTGDSGTDFEFLFPMVSTDAVDPPLVAKAYAYFIFAAGVNVDLDSAHASSSQAMYVPNVYIESADKEGYKAPPSAPFGDIATILLALTFLPVSLKLKNKLSKKE